MTSHDPVRYLLVETQTDATSDRFIRDGVALARAGSTVSLLLIADAIIAAVQGGSDAIAEFGAAGGLVWADGFTLTQRGVSRDSLADGVEIVEMDQVATKILADGTRTVWH